MGSFPLRSRGLIVVVVILGALAIGSAGALAASISKGKTSQHRAVWVYVAKPDRVTGLIIALRTRCTDHKRREIAPGFQAPFQHPRAPRMAQRLYDIVGRDAATGVRFRQRASFTAQLTGNTLTGSARVTQTFLATGVICRSPRVTFRIGL